MRHSKHIRRDFPTGLWHETWWMIALQLFYTKFYIWWTNDSYLSFLNFVSAVLSLLSEKKIYGGSGEINCTTRQYHPDIGGMATLVSGFNLSLYVSSGISSTSFVALCCTFSIMFIRCFWSRFQTAATYSMFGLTTDVNSDWSFLFKIYKRSLYHTSQRICVIYLFVVLSFKW